MIDTDKYEGHTGPWKLNKPVENGDYTIQDEMGTYRGTFYSRFRVEDARLMADAPLLLQALIDERAEVKRLRDELKFVVEMLEGKPSNMEWYECRNLILEQVVIDLDD